MNDNARVLIVDPLASSRRFLADLIGEQGYEPVEAAGSDEALQRIDAETVDLVLLDLSIGDTGALELLDRIANFPASLPVVVMSAPAQQELRATALARGACDCINKPVDRDEFCARVHNLVLLQRAREELVLRDRALMQAQKMEVIGSLVGGVSHDFNNLLTAIVSFAEFVRMELEEGDPRRDDIDEVLRAAERATDLTRQLLAFSRHGVSTQRSFDLNQRVLEVTKLLRRTMGARVEVDVTTSAQPAVVTMDPVQLDQVLLNLCVIVRDAMPAGGSLHLVIREPSDSTVRIDVSGGMDREILRRSFDPLLAAKAGGSTTGLGLAVCRAIIEESDGTIWLGAEAGTGTIVHIELPLSDEPVLEQDSDPRADLCGSGELILVAEDEPALRVIAQRTLEGAGYRVVLARDGAEAVRVLEERRSEVDLVFSDVVMPGASGSSVVEASRQYSPTAGILVTSGYIDEAGHLGRTLVEDRPILWKPYTPEMLLQAVQRALGRRDGVDARRRAVGREMSTTATRLAPITGFDTGLGAESTSAEASGTDVLVLARREAGNQLGASLRGSGYTVVVVTSVEYLAEALATQPYLAFAFDAEEHDGQLADILANVRGHQPNLPVIVSSSVASGELVRAVSRYNGIEYLSRPYEPADMRRAVENAIKTGRVAVLQSKLLAARAGADVFLEDLDATEEAFEQVLETLFMVYQPIVRSRDHSIFGYEALLRSNVPTLPNPPAILTAAEVLGRVVDLGRVVRERVRDDIDSLEVGIAVFVNLHPLELRERYLASSHEPLMPVARRIVLEVTERASLSGGPQLLEEVRRLRSHGYRIAVDDLGEGYAGLSSLAYLTPDIVKIDRSLVERIETSPLKEDIVASIVLMARKAGITTVAEGIETAEERDVLTMLGCDLLQGYYFARPGPPFPRVLAT